MSIIIIIKKDHEDAHYVAAIFSCQRELAVKFCHLSVFVCMDDKHTVKVGEPNYTQWLQ